MESHGTTIVPDGPLSGTMALFERQGGLILPCTWPRWTDLYNDLKKLRAAGYSDLYIGIETGSDSTLADIRKGCTAADLRMALGRLHDVRHRRTRQWRAQRGGDR